MTDTVDKMLPLYEAKMIHHFDHRWATYERDGTIRDVSLEEKQDPNFVVMPRYWVAEEEVDEKLDDRWDRDWLLGWRDICRSTDERTCIAGQFPRSAVSNKLPIILSGSSTKTELYSLQANLCSFIFDYVARQKQSSTSMNYFIFMQLALIPPSTFISCTSWSDAKPLHFWVAERVTEIESLSGYPSAQMPIRAELDAAFFHLYGIERDDVDYIMDTFPIVRRKDEAEYGEYRTKRLILESYDEMAAS